MTAIETFHRCDRWPFHFMLTRDRSGVVTIWGFSVYRRQPDYRTLGIPFDEWKSQKPNAGVRIEDDCDRRFDREFVRRWMLHADLGGQAEVGRG